MKEQTSKNFNLKGIILLILLLLPLFSYSIIIINGGNTYLYEDSALQFFPFRAFISNAYHNDYSPQWMPHSGFGLSILAEGQSSICFPIVQVLYRLFSVETGWFLEMLFYHLLSFIFCFLWLKKKKLQIDIALFGAAIYAFCSNAFIIMACPAIMWNYCLLPALLYAIDKLLDGDARAETIMIIVLSLIFLTGHPVMIIYQGIVFVIYYLLTRHANANKDFRSGFLIDAIKLLCILTIAVIIALPQILPMIELFPISARAADSSTSFTQLESTLHMSPRWAPSSLFPTPTLGKDFSYFINCIRFPYFVIIFAVIGTIIGLKNKNTRASIVLLLFSLLMALGPYVGLWKIIHSLPVLKNFRYPFRWTAFTPIFVCFLAGYGIHYVRDKGISLKKVPISILTFSSVAVVLASFFLYRKILIHQFNSVHELLFPELNLLIWIVAVLLLASSFCYMIFQNKLIYMACIVLSILTLSANRAVQIFDPMAIVDTKTIGLENYSPDDKQNLFRTSLSANPYKIWTSDSIDKHYAYTPNLTSLSNTLSTGFYFSFFPHWSETISRYCEKSLNGESEKRNYLDISSAKYIYTAGNNNSKGSTSNMDSIAGSTNTDALERIHLYPSLQLIEQESDILTHIEQSSKTSLRRKCFLLSNEATKRIATNFQDDQITETDDQSAPLLETDRPDHIAIKIEPANKSPQILVLNDTFYPGWKAKVDGKEQTIVRTNYAFRGVFLPIGTKEVEFFYDPLLSDRLIVIPSIAIFILTLYAMWPGLKANKRSAAGGIE